MVEVAGEQVMWAVLKLAIWLETAAPAYRHLLAEHQPFMLAEAAALVATVQPQEMAAKAAVVKAQAVIPALKSQVLLAMLILVVVAVVLAPLEQG
jgi:hypothetical protein